MSWKKRKSYQFYTSPVSQRIRKSRHRAQGHLESSGSLLMVIFFPAHQTVIILVPRETSTIQYKEKGKEITYLKLTQTTKAERSWKEMKTQIALHLRAKPPLSTCMQGTKGDSCPGGKQGHIFYSFTLPFMPQTFKCLVSMNTYK